MATAFQPKLPGNPLRCCQVVPESVETNRLPRLTMAASFEPSAEDATDAHAWTEGPAANQVAPKSVERKRSPLFTAASKRLPSSEEATDTQARLMSRAVQFTPALVEV